MQARLGDSVAISGYVARDAEFKYVGDNQTPLAKFGVKIGEEDVNGVKQAKWCNCVCWRNVADVAGVIQKGDTVFAIGKIVNSEYTNREGETVPKAELNCEFVSVMRQADSPVSKPADKPVQASKPHENVETVNDDDLPF